MTTENEIISPSIIKRIRTYLAKATIQLLPRLSEADLLKVEPFFLMFSQADGQCPEDFLEKLLDFVLILCKGGKLERLWEKFREEDPELPEFMMLFDYLILLVPSPAELEKKPDLKSPSANGEETIETGGKGTLEAVDCENVSGVSGNPEDISPQVLRQLKLLDYLAGKQEPEVLEQDIRKGRERLEIEDKGDLVRQFKESLDNDSLPSGNESLKGNLLPRSLQILYPIDGVSSNTSVRFYNSDGEFLGEKEIGSGPMSLDKILLMTICWRGKHQVIVCGYEGSNRQHSNVIQVLSEDFRQKYTDELISVDLRQRLLEDDKAIERHTKDYFELALIISLTLPDFPKEIFKAFYFPSYGQERKKKFLECLKDFFNSLSPDFKPKPDGENVPMSPEGLQNNECEMDLTKFVIEIFVDASIGQKVPQDPEAPIVPAARDAQNTSFEPGDGLKPKGPSAEGAPSSRQYYLNFLATWEQLFVYDHCVFKTHPSFAKILEKELKEIVSKHIAIKRARIFEASIKRAEVSPNQKDLSDSFEES